MSPQKRKVFISYSSKDSQFVAQLVIDLSCCKNLEIWEYSNAISPGDSIPDKISQALGTADKYIVVLSPNSVSSHWVDRELNTAINAEISKGKKGFVIPLLYQDCQRPKLIEDKLYADFSTSYQAGLQELFKALGCKSSKIVTHTKVVPSGYLKVASREIERKKSELHIVRPGFELGSAKELVEIGPSKNKTKAIAQFYDYGMFSWHEDGPHAGEAFATYGAIFHRYRFLGEFPWLEVGLPIGDEDEAKPSPFPNNVGEVTRGRYSSFENGEIIWYEASISSNYRDQAYVILDPIRSIYDSIGRTESYLGFPVSDTYRIKGVVRNDFEGGTIISLDGKQARVVHQLLRINYSDSPFNHNWIQYAGPRDLDTASIRLDTRPGMGKAYIALNLHFEDRAIAFPKDKYTDDQYQQRYLGVTIKSLIPNDWIRFYLNLKTDEVRPQYLEFDSRFDSRRFIHDSSEEVDYFQIPMPTQSANGEFHTLIIDLQKSVKLGFGRRYHCLKAFKFRGYIGITDLMVSDSQEAIEAVAINPIIVE